MNCPSCRGRLRPVDYEGVEIDACDACHGEWLDAGELKKIVDRRRVEFDQRERQAVAQAAKITPVALGDVARSLVCPKCGATTGPINYGGDTGIIIDRCTGCGGIWLDGGELEKIQMLIEGWEDTLPDDLKQQGPKLRRAAVERQRAEEAGPSRLPMVGPLINAAINGIVDLTD
jgi:Zn-finger nucleic acid-binding protein